MQRDCAWRFIHLFLITVASRPDRRHRPGAVEARFPERHRADLGLIGVLIAAGVGIMMSVASGKPTITEEFQK